jgi:aminobenzoyl-glutamate transport protein
MTAPGSAQGPAVRRGGWLHEPVGLFLLALGLVAVVSTWGAAAGWRVVLPGGESHAIQPLLSAEGAWWLLSHVVSNFTGFPPLGVVVVGILGISLAEQSGLLAALLRRALQGVPAWALGPFVLFIGINASIALDAGYVVVPPIAAALFVSAGRSPLAGLATAYAGVAAGYSANLALTAVDPILAGFTEAAAGIIEPGYRVAATCNWWFMAASTLWLTLASMPALAWLERSLALAPVAGAAPAGAGVGGASAPRARFSAGSATGADDDTGSAAASGAHVGAGPTAATSTDAEQAALRAALLLLAVLLALIVWSASTTDGILAGAGERHSRLIEASVPLLALCFALPALLFGHLTGSLRGLAAMTRALETSLIGLAPYLVVTFFAAQFVAAFNHTHLGEALAVQAGDWLAASALPVALLLLATMFLVMGLDLLIASASAKYALLAPVLVPTLMLAGVSPELAQAAYRVGDSVTNVVSPLNPYLVITLGYLSRYAPGADFRLLFRLMLPFVLCFALAWPALLLFWVWLEIPLGPGGPLHWVAGSNFG